MKILVDHGGYNNLGDIAMLESAVTQLKYALPDDNFWVVDRRTGQSSKIWNIPGINKHPHIEASVSKDNVFVRVLGPKRIKLGMVIPFLGTQLSTGSLVISAGPYQEKLEDFCRRYDGLLISGGGFLTDKFRYQVFNKCALILGFADQSKPVVLTGQQLGPFTVGGSRQLVSRALRKCNFVGLRDPYDSVHYCEKAGLSSNQYGVMGDDSLGLAPANDTEIDALIASSGMPQNSGFIAVNMRVSNLYAKEHGEHLERYAELIDKLIERTARPALVVPIALGEEDSDIHTGIELAKFVKSNQLFILPSENSTPANTKGILSRAWGAVGVSYHFCIFALSTGVPVVCLYSGTYYGQKARTITGLWNNDRFALSFNQLNSSAAVNHVLETLNDPDIRSSLQSRAESAVLKWRTIFNDNVWAAFGSEC